MGYMEEKKSKKVILSRKGFDSAAGGNASMIIQVNNEEYVIQPLPIPDPKGNNEYKDLDSVIQGKKICKLFKDADIVPRRKVTAEENQKKKSKMIPEYKCHLDPDVFNETRMGAFGQMNAAESHLHSNEVGEGDIFIFFGWYKYYKYEGEKLVKLKGRSAGGSHVLYGYLIVDQVYNLVNSDELKAACDDKYGTHPHCVKQLDPDEEISNNRLYVAKEKIEEIDIPGFGIFKYNDDLVLSKKGMTKSKWDIDSKFMKILDDYGCDITYHSNDKSWHRDEGYFQSVARGQEFVITSDSEEFYDSVINFIKENMQENCKM